MWGMLLTGRTIALLEMHAQDAQATAQVDFRDRAQGVLVLICLQHDQNHHFLSIFQGSLEKFY